jgi:SAM-dependent methyltransferase
MPLPDMDRALTFGAEAETYALWRPGYPDGAIDFLSPIAPSVVVDLGAGTGQLSGPLLDRGLLVHAVDADGEMVRVLARTYPAARAQVASADALPFAAGSVDAVLAATAFHWFHFDDTVEEVGRVLRPGGWLGLVYNIVVPVHDWEWELVAIDPDHKGAAQTRREPSWPFPSGHVERRWFPWDWHVTPDRYRNCLATNSAVMKMSDGERRVRLDAAEAIVRRARDEAGVSTVPVHHEAFCLKWMP